MQRFVLALAVAVIALTVWLTLDSRPPTMDPIPTAPPMEKPPELSAPDQPVTGRIPKVDAKQPVQDGPVHAEPEQEEEEGLPPGLATLTVFSRPEMIPVPDFRYLITMANGDRFATAVVGHRLDLQLEMNRMATVRVEAEGHEPSEDFRVLATDPEPNPSYRVELNRVPKLVGVRLTVLDAYQGAIRRVRLRLVARRPDGEALLWERENSDPEGIYRMPELRPGLYRIELKAIDDQGDVLPLMPHRQDIEFQGYEDQPILVVLQPAAQLRVSVRDAAGAFLGPTVSVRLLDANTQPVPTVFAGPLEGLRHRRQDGLPLPGPATLDEPVPAGSYTLQWRIGEGAVQTKSILLTAGKTLDVELR